jgi:hypothetical protein
MAKIIIKGRTQNYLKTKKKHFFWQCFIYYFCIPTVRAGVISVVPFIGQNLSHLLSRHMGELSGLQKRLFVPESFFYFIG